MVTSPEVEHRESVGWQVVPEEPPGTLGWWDGSQISVIAFWAEDHWEYVTEEWAGRDPAAGVLPQGAVDPRESGWWYAPDGVWYPPPPQQPPEGGKPGGLDRGRVLGWVAIICGCLVAVAYVLAIVMVLELASSGM